MRGLLLKDLINIKGQWTLYLLMTVLWFAVGLVNGQASFFSGVMQIMVVMIPLTVAAGDEVSGWETFALTMPVTRRQMVLSRYLLVGVILVPISLLSLGGTLFISGNFEDSLLTTLFAAAISLAINSVMLPVLYRFGVIKGRFVFLGVVAVFILSGFLVGKLPVMEKAAALSFEIQSVWVVLLIFWVAALICIVLSFMLSRRIYAKKEF